MAKAACVFTPTLPRGAGRPTAQARGGILHPPTSSNSCHIWFSHSSPTGPARGIFVPPRPERLRRRGFGSGSPPGVSCRRPTYLKIRPFMELRGSGRICGWVRGGWPPLPRNRNRKMANVASAWGAGAGVQSSRSEWKEKRFRDP